MRNAALLFVLFTTISTYSFALVESEQLTLNFESDEYELSSEHVLKLNAFLGELIIQGDFEFFVTGHTDRDGGNQYNMALSEKRANSILDHFKTIGLNTNTTNLNFRGEYEPLTSDFDRIQKGLNRRVDIIFKRYNFENIDELMKELYIDNCTEHSFNSQKNYTIQGESGTIIKIEENSFITENGATYQGQVELKLTEALDILQYFEEGLSTMSDGQLLISGGMYKLEAFDSSGNSLQLVDGRPVQVAMPSDNIQDGMNVFVSINGADWDMTDQEPLTAEKKFILPEEPKRSYPSWRIPLYEKNTKNKPRKPSEPFQIKKPKLPNRSAYQVNLRWYQFMNRNKIRTQAANRYSKAMQNYQKELTSYNVKFPEFQIECDLFSEKLNNYYEELSMWKLNEKDKEREYYEIERQKYSSNYDKQLRLTKAKYLREKELWRAECDSILSSYSTALDEIGLAPSSQATQYIFQQADLGWINIDRFYDLDGGKTDLVVKNENKQIEGRVFIHFTEIGSCLNLVVSNGVAIQKNIPRREPAKLIAYQISEGGIQWFEKDVTDKSEVNLNYNTIKFSEFRAKIDALSKV